MKFKPFTTVWLEFATVEKAWEHFLCTHYPARLSPECDRSVDIMIDGHCIPTKELRNIPGVCKRPEMFVLDPYDPLPFLETGLRRLPQAA